MGILNAPASTGFWTELVDRLGREIGPAWAKDFSGRYRAVSPRHAESVGARPEAMIGIRDSMFWPAEDAQRFAVDDAGVWAHGAIRVVPEWCHSRGWLTTVKAPLVAPDGTGGTVGVIVAGREDAEPLSGRIEAVAARLHGRVVRDAGRCGVQRVPALSAPDSAGWLDSVRRRVDARFRDGVRVRCLAEEVGVTPVHLGRSFKAAFGTTVARYARALRVEWAAAELLRSPERPVGEVGLDAGFADQPHFTREFARTLGAPPSLWRRRGPAHPA